MSIPYTDGTFTSAKQNGATVVSFPFLNNPTKDTTTKQYQTNYAQLAGSYTPAAALNTFPGDAVFAANPNAYLVDESIAQATGAIYNFSRKWSTIPIDQILPSTRYYNRPVMDNVFSGTSFAATFDEGVTSHVFTSRISIQSISTIAADTRSNSTTISGTGGGTVPITSASFTPDSLPGTAVTGNSSAGGFSFTLNASAATIRASMNSGAFDVTVVASSTAVSITVISGTLYDINCAVATVEIIGSGSTYTLQRRQTTSYLNNTQAPDTTLAQSRSATDTYNVPASNRTINANSHGGVVGDKVVLWNGNYIVAKGAVLTSSTNSFTVDLTTVPGANFAADTCGFSSDANACYVNGPKICTVKRTQEFYLPGVTPGITTFADIPTQTIYTDPTSWLGRIIAVPTGFATIEVSDLSAWSGPILMQEIDEVQMADAIDTVTP